MDYRPLQRAFYERNTISVGRELLGKVVVRRLGSSLAVGRIVEVEAYRGRDDPASHAYRGITGRSLLMFETGGFAYIYLAYGVSWCLNVTTEPAGMAGAVLIRALEPLFAEELMKKNRDGKEGIALTNGPGKLTQALRITGKLNGTDLTHKGDLYIGESPTVGTIAVVTSRRIGVSQGARLPWRFFIGGNRFVSNRQSKYT